MTEQADLQQCDVLIVGGGLVGATLAACLARDVRLRIVVVEKMPLESSAEAIQHPSYDARNTALANGTCHLYDQLGLWPRLRELAEPILQVRVSDQGGFGATVIDAEAEAVRALGYVIENRLLGQVLLAHVQQCAQVSWLAPAQVQTVKVRQNGVEVKLGESGDQPGHWLARLLVVADGAQSATCRQLGITTRRQDYGQTGIVTTVTPADGHKNTAWERFTPEGPLALLPQTEQRLGVTWCVNTARAEQLMGLDEQAFMAALRKAAGSELGELVRLGQRYTYPLALTLSEEQVRSRVVVLGNAAHALHPVAGQGFNMAVRDIATLTRVLCGEAAHSSLGQAVHDLGDLRRLQVYYEQRERDQRNTVLFSDQVTRLFSTSRAGQRLARNAGLLMFDVLPGAKRLLARHAMGRASSTWLPAPVLPTVIDAAQSVSAQTASSQTGAVPTVERSRSEEAGLKPAQKSGRKKKVKQS